MTHRDYWSYNLWRCISDAGFAAYWDSIIRQFFYPLPVAQDAKEFVTGCGKCAKLGTCDASCRASTDED